MKETGPWSVAMPVFSSSSPPLSLHAPLSPQLSLPSATPPSSLSSLPPHFSFPLITISSSFPFPYLPLLLPPPSLSLPPLFPPFTFSPTPPPGSSPLFPLFLYHLPLFFNLCLAIFFGTQIFLVFCGSTSCFPACLFWFCVVRPDDDAKRPEFPRVFSDQ